jgi:hypothetical protein
MIYCPSFLGGPTGRIGQPPLRPADDVVASPDLAAVVAPAAREALLLKFMYSVVSVARIFRIEQNPTPEWK